MAKYLYYANHTAKVIGRVEVDTKTDTAEFIKPGGESLTGVARDETYLYWCDETKGTIGRAKLDGTEVNNEWIKGVGKPHAICVDPGHVYWQNAEGFIGRATISGGAVEPKWVASGGSLTASIAVNSSHVYFATANKPTIGRVKLDGSSLEKEWLPTGANTLGIFLSPTHIYWGGEGRTYLGRAKLDGTELIAEWLKGVTGGGGSGTWGVTSDGTYIYIGLRGSAADIARAKLDGTELEAPWVTKNAEVWGVTTGWLIPEPEPEPEPEPKPEPAPEPEAEVEPEAPVPMGQVLVDQHLEPAAGLTLGPYFVGGFQDHPDFLPVGIGAIGAVNLRLKMVSGEGVYRVVLRWHQRRELTAPYVEDELLLARSSALLDQQFPVRGPWLTIVLEPRTIEQTSVYSAILQPVPALAPQSRLGSAPLAALREVSVPKEGNTQQTLPRTAPGPGTLTLAASGEGPTRTLVLEQLNLNGEWVRYLGMVLPAALAPTSIPLVLPASPLRATFANGTAAAIAVDLLLGAS